MTTVPPEVGPDDGKILAKGRSVAASLDAVKADGAEKKKEDTAVRVRPKELSERSTQPAEACGGEAHNAAKDERIVAGTKDAEPNVHESCAALSSEPESVTRVPPS